VTIMDRGLAALAAAEVLDPVGGDRTMPTDR
jgi:hypothetical protein